MYTIIIVIHVIACCILIATILLQSGRGGGLSGLFGGGSSQTIFGTRASTFLTRATSAAATAFLLTCISLTIISSRRGVSLLEDTQEITGETIVTPVTQGVAEEDIFDQTASDMVIPGETIAEETKEESPVASETQPLIPQE